MRVLSVGNLYPPAAAGGPERTWVAADRALAAAGHHPRSLTTAPVPGRPVPPGLDEPHVFRELRWYWRDFAFTRPRLRARLALERHNAAVLDRHLAEHRPGAVCWWGMGGMSLALVERVRRAGIPAVGIVGDDWMGYGRRADRWTGPLRAAPQLLQAAAERASGLPVSVDLSAAARWLFVSEALRGASAAGLGLARTGLISPGVDPAAFPPSPPPETFAWRLACVGRVEPVKGVATAIEALALLAPQATLTVRGDGDDRHLAELAELAARRRVADRVRFEPPSTGPVLDAYAAADAILFPVTWAEPWGLVPLEAMSVGRPVVATGTGGSGEYLRHERNALLVPPSDAAALAAAVTRLAADPPLRARLVEGGRATAAHHSEQAFTGAVIAALTAEAA